ncbi:MAG: UDP-N-acetylmuramoyl-L-alanine--D-glutamate ligase [Clostridiales bacterium]|jgi:UDP-N-acetylmuramoylalanine--D-glutamate ligase|nr:UDP-N-acetylmuramoyl-L-alanine--D-glutamate ligase [Clostridiales bacterium]
MQSKPALSDHAIQQYAGKTALVIGAARSGLAAAELLLALGAKVLLNDSKPRENFPALPEALQAPACELLFGKPADALLQRVDFLVISPGIPIDAPVLNLAREMGKPVYGELAFAASCATQDIIAVSGTNGKTTTVSLLGEIFSQAGRVVHVAGNIGFPLSAAVLRAKKEDLLIAEVSSFQLETVDGFHPLAAAMLNIAPDHLDRHHDMETYINLKKALFINQTGQDYTILNHDDAQAAAMARDTKAKVVWFSLSGGVTHGAVCHDDQLFWRDQGEDKLICGRHDLKIPGQHNVENALAAIAVAHSLDIPLPVISYALRVFAGVEHRIEFVRELDRVRWLNDSKGTNPDSTIKAIQSMTQSTVLIAGGYDKQIPFASLADAVANSGKIGHVVLFGQTAQKIKDALTEANYLHTTLVASLEDAVLLAQSLAKAPGNVLFSPACASFDMFHDYEQRGKAFKHLVLLLNPKGD